MSRTIVPVNIRPHLVPFFYQEFVGVEAQYLNRKVKAAKISTRSHFGKIIRLMLEKSGMPVKGSKYNMFLSVRDIESDDFFGSLYSYQAGTYNFLRLPEKGCALLNDHLEDAFRISLTSFIIGFNANKRGDIEEALNQFIDAYNLREFGFEVATLRRYYDRQIEGSFRLKRMQKSVSNQSINYY